MFRAARLEPAVTVTHFLYIYIFMYMYRLPAAVHPCRSRRASFLCAHLFHYITSSKSAPHPPPWDGGPRPASGPLGVDIYMFRRETTSGTVETDRQTVALALYLSVCVREREKQREKENVYVCICQYMSVIPPSCVFYSPPRLRFPPRKKRAPAARDISCRRRHRLLSSLLLYLTPVPPVLGSPVPPPLQHSCSRCRASTTTRPLVLVK